jgi:phage/plasmid-like protein (TIGR03299 family)
MAHDLNIEDGRASLMTVGERPWHGLGQQLSKPATAAEAIHQASLDWRVAKVPLFRQLNEGQYEEIDEPRRYAVVRKSQTGLPKDDAVLGIVGENYTPLQNHDAFGFFDAIVGENAAIYHTAGALGRGEQVWLLAKLPEDLFLPGDDRVERFLLLSNSHDGSSSVRIKFTPVRVVCQNTLTMALRGGPDISVPHYSDVQQRLRRAADLLGLIRRTYDGLDETFQAMARLQFDGDGIREYVSLVFPMPDDERREAATQRAVRSQRESIRLAEEGRGNDTPGVRGTLWAAYNGVTEYVDHHVGASRKSSDEAKEARMRSIWFGDGAAVKGRAYRVAASRLRAGHFS